MKKLILKLNNYEHLELKPNLKPLIFRGMSLDQFTPYLNVKLVFHSYKQKYILSHNRISWDVLGPIITTLRQVLNNHSMLDFVVNRDLGYMHNEDLNLPMNKWEFGAWQGKKFLVWEAPGAENYLETWFYNDEQGNIIMSITELYGWGGLDKSFDKNYISYKKFMKHCRAPLTCIIPHQVARQWLAQCEYLLAKLWENHQLNSSKKGFLVAHGIYI